MRDIMRRCEQSNTAWPTWLDGSGVSSWPQLQVQRQKPKTFWMYCTSRMWRTAATPCDSFQLLFYAKYTALILSCCSLDWTFILVYFFLLLLPFRQYRDAFESRHALSPQSRRLSQTAGQRTHSTPWLPSSTPFNITMSASYSSISQGSAPCLYEHLQEAPACDFGAEDGSRSGKDDGIFENGKTQCQTATACRCSQCHHRLSQV